MDQDKLIELIDSCRSGHHDLDLPEMSELAELLEDDGQLRQQYRRAMDFDAALGTAMHDVPLPAGLAERLLVKLEDAPAAAGPQEPPRRVSRRAVWTSLLSAAALLLVAVGCWQYFSVPVEIGRDEIHRLALEQFPAELAGGPLNGLPGPAALPVSGVNARLIRGWSNTTFANRNGVAYHLTAPTGVRAILFVAPAAGSPAVPAWLPVSPVSTVNATVTGRVCTTWASGGQLYVLVVEGNHPFDLDQFIRAGQAT